MSWHYFFVRFAIYNITLGEGGVNIAVTEFSILFTEIQQHKQKTIKPLRRNQQRQTTFRKTDFATIPLH